MWESSAQRYYRGVAIKLSTDSAWVVNPQVVPSCIPYLDRGGRLMQRMMVYVVGFNRYYRLRARGRRLYCWLDLRQSVEE